MSLSVTNIGTSCANFSVIEPSSMPTGTHYYYKSDPVNGTSYYLIRNVTGSVSSTPPPTYTGSAIANPPPFFLINTSITTQGVLSNHMKFRLKWESSIPSYSIVGVAITATGDYLPRDASNAEKARNKAFKRRLMGLDLSTSTDTELPTHIATVFSDDGLSITLDIDGSTGILLGTDVPRSTAPANLPTAAQYTFRPTLIGPSMRTRGTIYYNLLRKSDWDAKVAVTTGPIPDNAQYRVLNVLTGTDIDILDPDVSVTNDAYLSVFREDSQTTDGTNYTYTLEGFRLASDSDSDPTASSTIVRTINITEAGTSSTGTPPNFPASYKTFTINGVEYYGFPRNANKFMDRSSTELFQQSHIFLLQSTQDPSRYLKFSASSSNYSPTGSDTTQYAALRSTISTGSGTNTRGFTAPTLLNVGGMRKIVVVTRRATNSEVMYYSNLSNIAGYIPITNVGPGSVTSSNTLNLNRLTFRDYVVDTFGSNLYVLSNLTATNQLADYIIAKRTITADPATSSGITTNSVLYSTNSTSSNINNEPATYRSMCGNFGFSGNDHKIYVLFSDDNNRQGNLYTFTDTYNPAAGGAPAQGFATTIRTVIQNLPSTHVPIICTSSATPNIIIPSSDSLNLIALTSSSFSAAGTTINLDTASLNKSTLELSGLHGTIRSISFTRAEDEIFIITVNPNTPGATSGTGTGHIHKIGYNSSSFFTGQTRTTLNLNFSITDVSRSVQVEARTIDETIYILRDNTTITKHNRDGTPFTSVNIQTGQFLIPYLGLYWDEEDQANMYQHRAYRISDTKFVWQRGTGGTTQSNSNNPFLFSDSNRPIPELLPAVGFSITPDLSEEFLLFELEQVAGSRVRVKDGFGNYLARFNSGGNFQYLGFIARDQTSNPLASLIPSASGVPISPAAVEFNCIKCSPAAGQTRGGAVCNLTPGATISPTPTALSGLTWPAFPPASVSSLSQPQARFVGKDLTTGSLSGTISSTGTITSVTVVNPATPTDQIQVVEATDSEKATTGNSAGLAKYITIRSIVGRRLEIPTGPVTTNGFTVIVLLRNISQRSGAISTILGNDVWETGAYHIQFDNSQPDKLQIASRDSNGNNQNRWCSESSVLGTTPETFALMVSVSSTGSVVAHKNKSRLNFSTSVGVTPNLNKRLNIGAWNRASPDDRTMNGDIGEFILYNSVIDPADYIKIYDGYLKIAYGLPL